MKGAFLAVSEGARAYREDERDENATGGQQARV